MNLSFLDFIFSNLWVLLILFFVFRTVLRGVMRGGARTGTGFPPNPETARPPYQPHLWGFDEEQEASPSPAPKAAETAAVDTPRTDRQDRRARVPAIAASLPDGFTGNAVPSPVEGMKWSQIYGRPRSMAPYQRKGRVTKRS
jgi:hypothetical protein